MGFNTNGVISASVAATGTTTIGTITIPARAETLALEVANANSYDLDAFAIVAKAHPAASGVTVANSSANFTQATIAPPLVRSTVDFTTLAKNTQGLMLIDVRSIHSLTFTASANGGASEVTIRYSA